MSARAKIEAARHAARLEAVARSAAYLVCLLTGLVPGQRRRNLNEVQSDALNLLKADLEAVGALQAMALELSTEKMLTPEEMNSKPTNNHKKE